jgi:hypothetical protein
MARLATYDRDVWCTACALIEQHGGKAMVRAAKAADACLAEKDLNGALTCMQVAEAVYVLLTEQPEHGERIH